MSKKKLSKKLKVLLIILIVLVLLGVCFLAVAIYARSEFNKERSWLPPKLPVQKASVTELPDNIHDAYEYAMRLYDEALHAEAVEGSWHTDVNLGGDMTLPFSDADNAIVSLIRDSAAGPVQNLYPHVSGVKMTEEKAEDLPVINLKESDILAYNYDHYDPKDVFNRKGEYLFDTYELVFKIDPSFENADEIRHGAVYEGICDLLKDAMVVNDIDLDVHDVEIRFRIDRLTDRIDSVDVSRSYSVKADITLTEAFADLLPDESKSTSVTLPYKATEHVSFMWYGLRFIEDYLEQKPDDIITMPLEIHVNSKAVQGEDFTVTYTVSDPGTMEIEEDGSTTILKVSDTSETEGIKVTATLDYEGKSYTDEMIIYITELDQTTAGVRFYEESFSMKVGETLPLPADVRVPINEAAESRREEEYELICVSSDPDALTIEVDGKDIYATALKATDSPVTVSVTMDCGGHTYFAEIPIIITKGTEADK